MKIRELLGSSIGNVLECYDFQLFAIFSPIIGKVFFPTASPNARILETLTVFAVGFLCRPIGSLLFGYRGDRKGRAGTLKLSILLIALTTLLIAFLPTWSQVGILSPILLLLLRMCQGISLGGEYSGNLIFLAETAPIRQRAFITSFACVGANLGILLALGIGTLCALCFSEQHLEAWGWRIPWLISGIISLFVCLTRLKLKETITFQQIKSEKRILKNPVITAFQKNRMHMLRTVGFVCFGAAFYYFTYIWLPTLLENQLHFSIALISSIMSCCLFATLFFLPLAGYLCDKIPRKKMLLFNSMSVALFIIPGLYFLYHGQTIALIIMLPLFIIFSCLEQAATAITVVENFPAESRYTGLSLGYNFGNGLIGGTAPFICTCLMQIFNNNLAPGFYIAGCALITFVVVWFFIPNNSIAESKNENKNNQLIPAVGR